MFYYSMVFYLFPTVDENNVPEAGCKDKAPVCLLRMPFARCLCVRVFFAPAVFFSVYTFCFSFFFFDKSTHLHSYIIMCAHNGCIQLCFTNSFE